MRLEIFYPPNCPDKDNVPDASLFLAGTIDMGQSENWQAKIIEKLQQNKLLTYQHIHVYNPRRPDWNADWKQSIQNEDFKKQVEWELDAITSCSVVGFNILADSKSPITLMELGLCAGLSKSSVVLRCEEGFWRKGNVDILAERYGIPQVNGFDQWVETLVQVLLQK